ncbi:MAG: hypothetical protein GC192_17165 [Bacteroidetes bacterium]|nr:hypothetical protein [Bacteroidota bacterium]
MKTSIFFWSAFLCIHTACQRTGAAQVVEPPLLAWFQSTPNSDTLHFEIDFDTEEDSTGSAIPNSRFFSSFDTSLLQKIQEEVDSVEVAVFAQGRYVLNDVFDACLVDIHQYWFRHQWLLLYNKQRRAFTDFVPVADWSGGDGGQVLIGSWMFDANDDGQKDIVRRQIEHWLILDDNSDGRDTTVEDATLLLGGKNGEFVKSPTANSAEFVGLFPIKSVW